jgi:hypothetical protein
VVVPEQRSLTAKHNSAAALPGLFAPIPVGRLEMSRRRLAVRRSWPGPACGNDAWEEGTPPQRGRGSTTDASVRDGDNPTNSSGRCDDLADLNAVERDVVAVFKLRKIRAHRSPAGRAFSSESKMIIASTFNSLRRSATSGSPP